MKWLNVKAVATLAAGVLLAGGGALVLQQIVRLPSAMAAAKPAGDGIHGTIRTSNGQPVAGAKVYLSRTRFGSKVEQQKFRTVHDATTKTDADGNYAFPRVAPGDIWISWRADRGGYDVQYRYFDLQSGQALTADIGGRGRAAVGRAVLFGSNGPVKFYGSRFVLLGLNFDTNVETAKEHVARHGLAWTHCFLGENPEVIDRYRLRKPTTMLVGIDGRILQPDLGGAEITSAIEDALGKK